MEGSGRGFGGRGRGRGSGRGFGAGGRRQGRGRGFGRGGGQGQGHGHSHGHGHGSGEDPYKGQKVVLTDEEAQKLQEQLEAYRTEAIRFKRAHKMEEAREWFGKARAIDAKLRAAGKSAPKHVASDKPANAILGSEEAEEGFALVERKQVTPTSYVLRFALPKDKCLGVGGNARHLKFFAKVGEAGARIGRDYTIVSPVGQTGFFDIVVKAYNAPHGRMGRYLCEKAPIGEKVQAVGPLGRLTYSDDGTHTIRVGSGMPKRPRTILMLVAGSGIAAVLQILRHIHRKAHHDEPREEGDGDAKRARKQTNKGSDATEETSGAHGHSHGHDHGVAKTQTQPAPNVLLLYASRERSDIIVERELRHFAGDSRGRLKVVFSVSNLSDSPADTKWGQGPQFENHAAEVRGRFNEELVQKLVQEFSSEDIEKGTFISGPSGIEGPPSSDTSFAMWCGPETFNKFARSAASKLGYTQRNSFEF